jgi:hypothetical protein
MSLATRCWYSHKLGKSPSTHSTTNVIKVEDDLDLLMPIQGLSKNFEQQSEYIKKEKEKQGSSFVRFKFK